MSETLLGMYVFEMIFFVLSSSYNLKLFYIPPGLYLSWAAPILFVFKVLGTQKQEIN